MAEMLRNQYLRTKYSKILSPSARQAIMLALSSQHYDIVEKGFFFTTLYKKKTIHFNHAALSKQYLTNDNGDKYFNTNLRELQEAVKYFFPELTYFKVESYCHQTVQVGDTYNHHYDLTFTWL